MPLYVFYPTLKSGLCHTFQSIELDGDDHVDERALRMLDQHVSADSVVVYSEHRKVLTRVRVHPALVAILGDRVPQRSPALEVI
jgi:hypothetical protein